MRYVVYVNHRVCKARVHRMDCPEYSHRKADETRDGFWKGPFRNFGDALNGLIVISDFWKNRRIYIFEGCNGIS